MTTPEEQPTVGDFLARLEFKYDNDVLDFLKTGKGVVVVEDKVANIPLPQGEKGEKGDIGQLREGDVRYFNHRTDEAEAAAEASEASAGRSKTSEEAAKTSETNAKTSETNAKSSETKAKASETKAKTSETNAKSSETKAKASETNAKTSETNAKTSEGEAEGWSSQSKDAATLAITAAATLERHVADRDPTADDTAYKGSVWVNTTTGSVWMRGLDQWYPLGVAQSAEDAARRAEAWAKSMTDAALLESPPGSGLFSTGGQLVTEDPDNPGLYLIGA